jgi:hypothetical protein
MLLLNSSKRLSIDIDIIVPDKSEQVIGISKNMPVPMDKLNQKAIDSLPELKL